MNQSRVLAGAVLAGPNNVQPFEKHPTQWTVRLSVQQKLHFQSPPIYILALASPCPLQPGLAQVGTDWLQKKIELV